MCSMDMECVFDSDSECRMSVIKLWQEYKSAAGCSENMPNSLRAFQNRNVSMEARAKCACAILRRYMAITDDDVLNLYVYSAVEDKRYSI